MADYLSVPSPLSLLRFIVVTGTNKSSIASVANDLDFSLIAPFDTLNWLGPGVKIGRGFQEAWFDTALQILDQVKAIKQQYSNASIVVTGHSLGASTALLGALHLNHALEVPISTIVFGLPRTGNQAVRKIFKIVFAIKVNDLANFKLPCAPPTPPPFFFLLDSLQMQ